MNESPHLTLVLGGARSGKSAFAEQLVAAHPAPWLYISTAQALDDEMRRRVALHRARRGPDWLTVEAPLALAQTIAAAPAERPILVDCLTLWLSNRLALGADLSADRDELLAALERRVAPVVLVSSEVGLSVVPDNALARSFRDAAGELHQAAATRATRVFLVVAGYPMKVK
ncbi:MAG: bifunctional adenosylcobinamide kinase/adenosylcobinamide-phosphate guanylyltransferase [Methylocystis sp.]|nr:bifunctional adenosylcobinamide kinase/adenosylcobinamide-phosphate guanylyltransferase [Methylocystis sp.]MBI3275747.1 bifunctional adenosylcobinamide kinase/adenosylcobinamide-phosphate guanylyltransferase [Methylocystis sp.]